MNDFVAFGSVGPLVGKIHQRLVELGYHVDQVELDRAAMAESTVVAIKSFQQQQKLVVDGIVGPTTLARLDAPVLSKFIAPDWRRDLENTPPNLLRALQVAIGDIGLYEEPNGSNDGPMLKKYDTRGASWCALAVSYWLRFAEGGCPFGRESSSWSIFHWANARGLIIGKHDLVLPGDVALILRVDPTTGEHHGHTMLVSCALPDFEQLPDGRVVHNGRICTVAGNEGNAVRGGIRDRGSLSAIVRPVK